MIRREEGRKKVRIHIVQKGDTLWKIAKEYGISFEDLKRLNVHLANPDYIVPGMEIILPERIHKAAPVQPSHHIKEGVKKEVPKPSIPSVPAPTPAPTPTPMPMPQMPQMIPIPFPMPMPQPQPPQMWMQQPLEMHWNQQLVMPQMEQPVLPPIHIQPAPLPAPVPPPPPVIQPPPPTPPPMQILPQVPQMPSCQSCHQPPMHIMPQIPHCSCCHQPMHHQMFWPMQPMPMPMLPQGMPMSMSPQGMPMPMPACDNAGAGQFQESSSFSSLFNVHQTHNQPMNQPCESPPMMQDWQFDQCHCQPPCAPWMPPQFFPGGMTPYRW